MHPVSLFFSPIPLLLPASAPSSLPVLDYSKLRPQAGCCKLNREWWGLRQSENTAGMQLPLSSKLPYWNVGPMLSGILGWFSVLLLREVRNPLFYGRYLEFYEITLFLAVLGLCCCMDFSLSSREIGGYSLVIVCGLLTAWLFLLGSTGSGCSGIIAVAPRL